MAFVESIEWLFELETDNDLSQVHIIAQTPLEAIEIWNELGMNGKQPTHKKLLNITRIRTVYVKEPR